jgi:glycosyl transferase family 87
VALGAMQRALGVAHANSPPTFTPAGYLVVLPFTALPFDAARVAWTAAGQACLAGALWAWARAVRAPGMLAAVALAVALVYQPVFENVALGQLGLVIVGLLAVGIASHVDGRLVPAALALSLAVQLKPHFLLLLPFIAWIGAPALALATLGGIGAWLLLSLAVFGTSWLPGWLTTARALAASPWLHVWPRNLSPHATLHRALGDGGPRLLTEIVSVGVAAAVVAGAAWATRGAAARGRDGKLAGWSLALCALPLVSPLTEEHHLAILLLPLLFAVARLDDATPSDVALVAAAAVLLGGRYSFESVPALASGPGALAYGAKAAGAVVLGTLMARMLRRLPRAVP